MGTVGISFGSATGGSGFDVASTVTSIMATQRTPEAAWATRSSALQAQDTVLSTLGTDVSALSTALSSLTSFDGVFSGKTGATSNTDAVVLSNVSSSALPGIHKLTVTTLAQTSQSYSSAVASSATLSGTLSFTVGAGSSSSGTTTSLTVASGSTITQVAAQINASSAGITASVITDSNGSRLSLASTASGSATDFTASSSGLTDSGGNTVSFTQSQAGVDAAYTLDGASLTSSGNTITTALPGVSFQLVGKSSSPVLLQVAADTSSVSTTLSTFVAAYNTLSKALAAQEGKDSSGNAQPLFGTSIAQQLQSGLATALNFTKASTSSSAISLESLGVTAGTDGTLTLDGSTLTSALSSRLDDIATFFQSKGYFGQNFTNTLTNLGSTGKGALALATKNNSTEETDLAANKSALEARLTVYQANLTTELNTANEILQAIPTTLQGITSLFNAITGNKGG